MDYDTFSELCKEKNTTPTALTLKLGLSKGNTSSWKKGGNPSVDILIKLADELNCTTDKLLGRKEKNSTELNDDEQGLLKMYGLLTEREKGEYFGELKEKTKDRME